MLNNLLVRPSTLRVSVRKLSASLALFVSLAWAADARAFCRTTTCYDCPQPADGCVTEGIPLFWPTSCVSYDLQKDASRWADLNEASAVAERAFGAWQEVQCDGQPPSVSLRNNGPVVCASHEYNDQDHSYGGNANIIVFRDDNWVDTANPNASTLAITTVTFNRNTGEIYDADIEVNGSKSISTANEVPPDSYDLQSILTHEVGHFLGVAHSPIPCSGPDCPTMNANYQQGSDVFRTLETDDRDAMCAIYAPARAATPNEPQCLPRHGFSEYCGSTGTKGGCCSTAPGGAPRGAGEAVFAALLGLSAWVVRGKRRPVMRSSTKL